MINFTRISPDSFDARKSPLIPALVFMTMTSFTPPPCNVNFVVPNAGITRGSSIPSISKEGLSLFMKEELEKRSKNQPKTGKLAQTKGVDLPQEISALPDETVSFLASHDVAPDFINATADGSLMIEFHFNGLYHMVEFWPDGDIVLLKRGDDGKDAWDLSSQTYFNKLKSELLAEPQVELVE